MFLRTWAPVILLALPLAAASAAELKIEKDWKGDIDAKAAKAAGEGLVIGDAKAWEKFWKSVRPKEKVPVIDFKKQAVLVMIGANIRISSLGLTDGNVQPDAEAAFDGAPMYHAVAFDRKGVKTVRRMPLPEAGAAESPPGPSR